MKWEFKLEWIDPKVKKPNHKQLVLVHVGYLEPDPLNTKVAEYDSEEDCFVFGLADEDFMHYAMCGFVRTEIVTGWFPFPKLYTKEIFK